MVEQGWVDAHWKFLPTEPDRVGLATAPAMIRPSAERTLASATSRSNPRWREISRALRRVRTWGNRGARSGSGWARATGASASGRHNKANRQMDARTRGMRPPYARDAPEVPVPKFERLGVPARGQHRRILLAEAELEAVPGTGARAQRQSACKSLLTVPSAPKGEGGIAGGGRVLQECRSACNRTGRRSGELT